jgi:hypothetical protein
MIFVFEGIGSVLSDGQFIVKAAILGVVVYAVNYWWEQNRLKDARSTWNPARHVAPTPEGETALLPAPQVTSTAHPLAPQNTPDKDMFALTLVDTLSTME